MPETTVATAPSTSVRVRIEHSRTQRDGWGYSSTVEVTEHDGPIEMETLQSLLAQVRFIGESERDERNRREIARSGDDGRI